MAGSLPVTGSGSGLEVAYNAASLVLDSERVFLIVTVQDNRVHYLAGDAADFALCGSVATCLASALPGAPGHHGHGAYFSTLGAGALTACVLVQEEGIKSFVGTAQAAARFPLAEQCAALPLYHLESTPELLAAMPLWRPFREYERADNRRLLRRLFAVGAANALVMTSIWLGASVYTAQLAGRNHDASAQVRGVLENATHMLADRGAHRHPAWQELQKLTLFALNHQGRLTSFEMKDGKLSWTMEVPDFVTGQEIEQVFKNEVRTREEGGRIRVEKGGSNS